jgi:hypothetical protein
MNSLLIKSVKFERPFRPEERPEVIWEFVAETDGLMPHGSDGFGGELRRFPYALGLWQARHYNNTPWSEPGRTREEAVQNVVPLVIVSMEQHFEDRKQREDAHQQRIALANQLNELLPAGFRVQVNSQPDSPLDLEYVFRIVADKLTEIDVRELAAKFKLEAQ